MKQKRIICAVLSLALLLGAFFTPAAVFNEKAYAAQPGEVVKLGTDVISYKNYTTEECIQVPCPSRGGIYFLNGEELTFYSLSDNKSELVYDFSNDRAALYDSYATADKLYILQYEYFAEKHDPYSVTVYNFAEQRVENVFYTSQSAAAVGADSSGRIYLAGREYQSQNYTISLFSPSMSLLSQTTADQAIYDFGAFDGVSGNFYVDGYANYIYWGYGHDMHALYVGNVSGDIISFNNNTPITYISQEYFFDRQSPMDILADRYLCVDTSSNSGMFVLNSNKIDSTAESFADTEDVFIERPVDTKNFDNEGSVGSRTVYLDGTNTIVSYVDDETLSEFDPNTGVCYGSVKTAYPVFSLLKYNDKIVAVEKSGSDYYLEMFNFNRASSLNVTGPNTVKIGESVQLTASTDGSVSEIYSWSSSNPKVASVNAHGEVFGWSEGTATIIVTTETGLKGAYNVTVISGLPSKNPPENSVTAKGAVSNNVSDNNYTVWSSVVNSYLAENADSTLTRVEFVNDQVLVETYSSDGNLLSTKKISPELPIFGGFYSGENYNFLVFGESNPSDSDEKEVVRIVKYDKEWGRLGAVSVKGANTHIPFDAGSLRMTETDGKLYIYTCHEMYTSDDGLNHQANMTFVVNESTMEIVDEYYDVMNLAQAGYVSHSFNQFIQTDGKNVYRVDHGDAHPRAISITSCEVSGSVENIVYTLPMKFAGNIGDNYTGASIGGFELSSSNCIIAGNAVDYSKSNVNYYSKRNIFVTVTDKSLPVSSKVVWLTNYDEGSEITVRTPQLVKLGNDQFLIAWEEYNGNSGKIITKIATIDDQGNFTSDILTSSLRLSDCKPILCGDGLVRWYYTDNSAPVICSVNPYNIGNEVPVSGDFEYEILSKQNKTCKITRYGGSASELEIPQNLDGYTVTGIADYAFSDAGSLTSVTVPRNVTSIGKNAFYGTALKTIYGYENSYAQTYAEENGYEFISLGSVETGEPGDVNGDEKINALDVLIVKRYIAKYDDAKLEGDQFARADVSGDGKVNAKDALAIMQKIAKLINDFNEIK